MKRIRVLFAGNPNTGKSTLINRLSGSRIHVSNWTGTTTQKITAIVNYGDYTLELIDLPGVYDFLPTTLEEEIAIREILNNPPDVIVNVVDASHLERDFHITVELTEMGIPMVVVLNMVDEARSRGRDVDTEALSKRLGVPVVATVARTGEGVDRVLEAIMDSRKPVPVVKYDEDVEEAVSQLSSLIDHSSHRWIAVSMLIYDDLDLFPVNDEIKKRARELKKKFEGRDLLLEVEGKRLSFARELARITYVVRENRQTITHKLDRVLLNPFFGSIIMLLLLIFSFRFAFFLSSPWVDFISTVEEVLAGWLASTGMPSLLLSFLVDGIIAGVGTVISFAPVLFLFYMVISFIEQSGILARAAFLMDTFMGAVGLPGKGFVPLIMGFGCNVPAVYATRTLESPRDRLKVAMMIPFMSCSARLPVLVLFASIFFPKNPVPVVLLLYLLGVIVAFITAFLMDRFIKGGTSFSVFELPPYRIPPLRTIIFHSWMRTLDFLRGAGTVILLAVIIVWFMLNFPEPYSEHSLFGLISRSLTGVFSLIGINDWRLIGSLIPGFIAKEVIIGSLAVSYLGAEPIHALGLLEGLKMIVGGFYQAVIQTFASIPAVFGIPRFQVPVSGGPLGQILSSVLNTPSALAYMVFVLLYTPCVATVAALKQEFGKRWAILSIAYQLTVAFLISFIIYRLAVMIHG